MRNIFLFSSHGSERWGSQGLESWTDSHASCELPNSHINRPHLTALFVVVGERKSGEGGEGEGGGGGCGGEGGGRGRGCGGEEEGEGEAVVVREEEEEARKQR